MNNFTFTNTLIIGASIITFLALSLFPELYLFGINRFFYTTGEYHIWVTQFFSSQLLHGSILHLAFNVVFVGYFGNAIERTLGYQKMFLFFILTSIFLGVLITFVSGVNTVGMSGFAMAILAYYTLELYSVRHPDYQGGITALIVNIMIGFIPGISLLGHLGGAIFGVIFWFGYNYYKKYI